MLVDTHCHLDDERYDLDREAVIERAKIIGVKRFISIGCDIENSKAAMKIAKAHDEIYFSAGIHPHEADKAPDKFYEPLKTVALKEKCVAIGECGLDYFYNHSSKAKQQEVFQGQIKLAHELKKPLIIHVRDAFDDCLRILKENENLRTPTIIHCFTGTLAFAKQLIDLGCTLSISGIVTFKKAGELHDVAKEIPLENLLIETDAPYLAPIPHRGKRNEPAYVHLVAQKIAELKGIETKEVIAETGKNAQAIFAIN